MREALTHLGPACRRSRASGSSASPAPGRRECWRPASRGPQRASEIAQRPEGAPFIEDQHEVLELPPACAVAHVSAGSDFQSIIPSETRSFARLSSGDSQDRHGFQLDARADEVRLSSGVRFDPEVGLVDRLRPAPSSWLNWGSEGTCPTRSCRAVARRAIGPSLRSVLLMPSGSQIGRHLTCHRPSAQPIRSAQIPGRWGLLQASRRRPIFGHLDYNEMHHRSMVIAYPERLRAPAR